MAEGGARRSGRTRTKSLKAELIAASEEKWKNLRKATSSFGQLTETPSEHDEQEEERSRDLEEVGVVSGKRGDSGENEGGVGEGIRKSVRKRKQVELFDPSATVEELSVGRVKRRQGLEGEPQGHDDVMVQTRWVGSTRGAESSSSLSGGKPPQTTKMAAERETVRQRRRAASDSSQAGSEGNEAGDDPALFPGPEGGEGEGEAGVWVPREGCWAHLEELCTMLPGRRSQVETLLTLWGEVRGEAGDGGGGGEGEGGSEGREGGSVVDGSLLLPAEFPSVPLPLCVWSQRHREDAGPADGAQRVGGGSPAPAGSLH